MQRASGTKSLKKTPKVAKVQAKRTSKKVAKLAKRTFTATKSARRMTVNWAKAQSPFSKSLPQEFVNMQSQLDSMWAETYAAPKEVAPLDFAPFDAKIKNKPALEALKKEYASKTFTVTKTQYQTPEAAAAKVKAAESEATFMRDSALMLKNRIQQLRYASAVIPFMTLEAQISLTPGLEQEFDRQLSNYIQVTDPGILKALDVDCGKITAALEAGNLPEIPAEGITKILYTPVYYAALHQHGQVQKKVREKYNLNIAGAEQIIFSSLKRQNALPTIEQVNQHLDDMQLPFVLSAIEPTGAVNEAFNADYKF